MKNKKVPEAAVRRLPKYLRCCEEALRGERYLLSSEEIASMLGTSASQVRQDLNFFGDFGQKGAGYPAMQLRRELEALLGLGQRHTAVIVGVGGIGRAVLEHMDISGAGYELLAGFDIDEALVGEQIGGVTIQDAASLEDFLRQNRVDACIIAASDDAAQGVAALAERCGVSVMLNLTNREVTASCGVFVENIHFYDSMLVMGYHLSVCG